eukprot:INCI683.3.p1 GENE.INCI683.3~~INCI683.3.p1  ORF type:complete len:333 (-),score=48.91 INCI683.3:334-1332(-)
MSSCSLARETQRALFQHCSSAGQELGDNDHSSSLSLQQQTFNFQLLLAMCYNSHLLLGSMNDPSLDPLLAKSINSYVYSLVENVTFKRLRCKPGMSVDELLRGLAVCLPTNHQPSRFRPADRFGTFSNSGEALGTGRSLNRHSRFTDGAGKEGDDDPASDAGLEARDPVVILYLERINVLPVDCQDLLCQMMTHNKWLTSDPERGIVQYHSSDVVVIGTVSNRRSELRLGCVGEIKDDLLDCFFSMLQPRDVFDVIAATTIAKDSKTVAMDNDESFADGPPPLVTSQLDEIRRELRLVEVSPEIQLRLQSVRIAIERCGVDGSCIVFSRRFS